VAVGRLERHQLGDSQQHLVRRIVAVRVVEQAEVVDVEQGHPDLPARPARGLDVLGEQRNDRPVIEHPGERIAAGRLDELVVLTAEARLGGSEDEEEDHRQEQAGDERDDHDVAPGGVQAGQERRCVAPHRHHGNWLVAALDNGEVFLEHVPGVERADRFDLAADLDDGCGRSSLEGRRHGRGRTGDLAHRRLRVARQDSAVEVTELDAEDLVASGQAGEQAAELGGPSRARAVLVEVGGAQVAVHEQLHQGRVTCDDAAERRARQVLRGDGHQGAGRHADEHQHEAEDEGKQHRTSRATAGQPSEQHIAAPYARGVPRIDRKIGP
jgi:hypothetical protein